MSGIADGRKGDRFEKKNADCPLYGSNATN